MRFPLENAFNITHALTRFFVKTAELPLAWKSLNIATVRKGLNYTPLSITNKVLERTILMAELLPTWNVNSDYYCTSLCNP